QLQVRGGAAARTGLRQSDLAARRNARRSWCRQAGVDAHRGLRRSVGIPRRGAQDGPGRVATVRATLAAVQPHAMALFAPGVLVRFFVLDFLARNRPLTRCPGAEVDELAALAAEGAPARCLDPFDGAITGGARN